MFSRSMSATDAAPTPTATARRRMTGASRSRWAADSVFESRTPGMRWQFGGMITAAATTAPHVGATPTSSTPTIRVAPSRHRGRSQRRVGTIAAIADSVPRAAPCDTRPMQRRFAQVDVFTTTPGLGNPLAVVLDGDDLTTDAMQRFARWTNLSETTFVVPARDPGADYGVRIFTPTAEIPFAGHPTLGTCHAWLEAGGVPRDPVRIVQECGTGLVEVRRTSDGLAFLEPPILRWGPVDGTDLVRVAEALSISSDEILAATWCDNGPGWMAVRLESAERVLGVRIGPSLHLDLGIVGTYPPGSPAALEVRAAWPEHGSIVEDPATGSLNASVARWLIDQGVLSAPYVATQGAAIGRAARFEITQDPDGTVLVGGRTVTLVTGTVDL